MSTGTDRSTVLLVGSRGDARDSYASALRSDGLDVRVSDFEKADSDARRRRPDLTLLVCDARTYEDALAFTERVRIDSDWWPVPILLASLDFVAEGDLRRATDSGAVAISVTGSDGTKLVGAVRGLLAAHDGVKERIASSRSSRIRSA